MAVGVAHDVRVSVLGAFSVSLDGQPVPDEAWRRNRARALVKLLALAQAHRLHREQLMDALWPALDADAAAGNLRKAIHFARQAIGAEHITVRGDLVALEASAPWVDAQAFEAAVQAGQRREALALYLGELLPEDRFEPWTEDPRERLRKRFHSLLLEEAAALEVDGRFDAAADVLERLVADDPLHEEAHLVLIRVLALGGSRHLALDRYRQLERRLRDELGVEPDPAVRQLVEEISSGRFAPDAVLPGRPLAPSASPSSGDTAESVEERRLVTAMSAAVATDADDPELRRRELDAWTEGVREIVETWGGAAEMQAGGDLMVVFGVPIAHEDDASRAMRAALEIIARAPHSSRIGVATGEIIAAFGGEAPRRRITGAVVADAASIREAAGPGSVLTTERTHRAAGAGFRFSDPITLRMRGELTVARELLGERPALQVPLMEAPLIGRDPELAVVLDLIREAVSSGHPRLVELSGPAGVGKSRLARELIVRISEHWSDAMILPGRCLPGGRGSTFGALGDMLREACGIATADNAKQVRHRLREGLAHILGTLDPADRDSTTFALATTAGISVGANPLERLPPSEVADRLGLAWPVFASACASAAPVFFVIEDLHWGRLELLDIIEHVLRRAAGPVVILATARPELREARPSFAASDADASTIAIRPLGQADSEELVDSLLADGVLEPRVRGDLLARAEGNPFYLEQLVHHLRSGGSTTLPDTLQSLLAARLDALPIGERRVLQEAAVAGRVFWEEPIQAAIDDGHVAARLAALERKGFVVRLPISSLPGQAEFSIRHVLLHDVAYGSLSRARRARAHAAIGSWLETMAGDRIDEIIDLLAHHYWAALSENLPELTGDGIDRASIRAKAFRYVLRAGDAARRRFVIDRAVELHERARAIAVGADEQLAALEALARDRENEFHGDEAASLYRAALAIARDHPGRPADRARLCRQLAWIMAWNPGAFRVNPDAIEAEALVDEGMTYVQDETERAWLLLVRGACARLYRGSEPLGQGTLADPRPIGERIAAAHEALAFARELDRDELAAAAGQALGMLYGLAGRYDEMVELATKQVADLRPEHSRLDQSDAIRKLAVHLVNVRADFEQGLELGWRSRRLLGAGGGTGPHQVMHTLWPILASLFYLGRWDELLEPLDEHIEAFRAEPATACQIVRDGPVIGAATLTLLGRSAEAGRLAALLGDPLTDRDSASAWQARLATISGHPEVARTISHDKALEGRGYGPQHALALLEALTALREWNAARTLLPVARRTIPGNALLGPMTDRVAGLIQLADGDAGRAVPFLRRAARGFRRFKVPFEEARTLEALAQALPSGAASAAEALAIYDRLGAKPSADTLREAVLLRGERAGIT